MTSDTDMILALLHIALLLCNVCLIGFAIAMKNTMRFSVAILMLSASLAVWDFTIDFKSMWPISTVLVKNVNLYSWIHGFVDHFSYKKQYDNITLREPFDKHTTLIPSTITKTITEIKTTLPTHKLSKDTPMQKFVEEAPKYNWYKFYLFSTLVVLLYVASIWNKTNRIITNIEKFLSKVNELGVGLETKKAVMSNWAFLRTLITIRSISLISGIISVFFIILWPSSILYLIIFLIFLITGFIYNNSLIDYIQTKLLHTYTRQENVDIQNEFFTFKQSLR